MKSIAMDRSTPSVSPAIYAGAFNKALDNLFGLDATDTTELILVRHAEPDYHAAAREGDALDPPLSERGRCQAIRLSQRLRSMEIDAIQSPLKYPQVNHYPREDPRMIPCLTLTDDRRELDAQHLVCSYLVRACRQAMYELALEEHSHPDVRQRAIQVLKVVHQDWLAAQKAIAGELGAESEYTSANSPAHPVDTARH